MTTVASRAFRSSPYRDAAKTWAAIVDVLTGGDANAKAKGELLAVSGVASSVIADRAVENAPIVVTCDGPRTRIYCLYDDAAIEESDPDEGPLGFDPLRGEWQVSLPCLEEDLAWVQRALANVTARVVARDAADGLTVEESTEKAAALSIDLEGFLRS